MAQLTVLKEKKMSNELTPNSFWVVIPTYNRADDLIATLESLAKSEINMDQVDRKSVV